MNNYQHVVHIGGPQSRVGIHSLFKLNKKTKRFSKKNMVSSGIEPLIPALLARCLNQLGQETKLC